MKKTFKITGILLLMFISGWLFSNHTSETYKATSTLSVSDTIYTSAVQTVAAEMHTSQTQSSRATLLPTTLSFPTATFLAVTESSSPTPFPSEIAAILPDECRQTLVGGDGDSPFQVRECKLPVISPDGKYLAYVFVVAQEKDSLIHFFESIQVMDIDTGLSNEIHMASYKRELSRIKILEWSATSKLVFFESLWEGPGVTFVYDPASEEMLTTMRAYSDTALRWNPQKTAFYALRLGGYGADSCVGELNGYDFQSGQTFPNIYDFFNADEIVSGVPPYTNVGHGDSFSIEPHGWSQDGKHLWVTVTALDWQEEKVPYEYLVKPRQVGVFELSDAGVSYSTVATDEHFDYSFEGALTNSEPEIVSQPYQLKSCP